MRRERSFTDITVEIREIKKATLFTDEFNHEVLIVNLYWLILKLVHFSWTIRALLFVFEIYSQVEFRIRFLFCIAALTKVKPGYKNELEGRGGGGGGNIQQQNEAALLGQQ